MKSLLAALQNGKILVSDGAWGTLLHKRGLQIGECPELWNITHRSDVIAIAESYIDAGADIILTNSFGGSPTKLKHYGLQNRCTELNEAAADISRVAAGNNHLVLGSIGPSGVILLMGDVSEEELYNDFCIQAKALKRGGVDAICIETMTDIDEARIAIKAARQSTELEIACTFTFDKTVSAEYRTMMGVSPAEMVQAVKEAGASVIGSNCGNGFDQMIDVVQEIRKVDKTTPVLIHANAGKPVLKEGKTCFLETPEMMASKINELIRSGANIIGGCCGTTPEHIRAIAKVVKG
jgi:5-methyltetrahydrofolate--homocysteine methyltransferase